MRFVGFVPLNSTLVFPLVTLDSSRRPKDATSLPSFRVYSSQGLMANGTGSASKLDTGTITNATNATPIVITSANHGLTTGTKVVISGVTGNTAANGEFVITVIDSNSFSLNGSSGNGAYTGGGTWHVAGLYTVSVSVSTANGYGAGSTYFVLVSYEISGTSFGDTYCFTVT